MNPYKGKKILITGGTGSLGKGLLESIKEAKEIRVMSRSETGQIPLKDKYSKVKFILGDVRDLQSVIWAVKGVDIVIHAAAFKFLNLAEDQARECTLTNIIGSLNVIEAVIADGNVKTCLGISTDKVAYARNVYGCTKHIMEKLFKEADRHSKTKFCVVRYGNVLGTTGSVVTIWEKQYLQGKPLTVTDKRMRRFFLTMDDAVHLIKYALQKTKGGEVFVHLAESNNLYDMAKDLSKNVKVTGVRPGEKLFETLIADYEGKEYTSELQKSKRGIVTLK